MENKDFYTEDDIARAIASRYGRTIKDSKAFLHDFVELFSDLVKENKCIKMRGFMYVDYRDVTARDITLPNGTPCKVDSYTVPRVRISESVYR